jgi:HK97 family phage major capsid protein
MPVEIKKDEFATMVKDQVGEILTEQNEGFQKDLKAEIKDIITNTVKTEIGSASSKFIVDPDNRETKSGFMNFAEFAQNVWQCGPGGQNITSKMVEFNARMKTQQKDLKAAGSPGMSTNDGEAGGYLIPDEFRTELLSVAIDKTDIMARAMKVPMQTNSINIPYVNGFDRSGGLVHGGVQFKWLEEIEQKTATQPKVGLINLKLKKCAGLAYVSDEMLEDSPISMEPFLKAAFTDALAFELDWVAINGTGAGQPLGMLTSPCNVEVAKEGEQSADTIVFENIVKMYARMWRTGQAVWMANRNTFPQLSTMVMPVGTGGVPVYLPANGAAGQPNATLMGLPLIFTEHMRSLGDAGDIGMFDWSQYLIGNKAAGLQFASSIHLKFDYDQTAFRFVYRIDGQPWWKSAMTPRYASETLSPCVTLAERA